jgi:hypothetical protein
MTIHRAAFWLDHNELRAIALDSEGAGFRGVAHLHSHDTHTHPKKVDGHRHPLDPRFLLAVEDALAHCDEIALFGPALAKDELVVHLEATNPSLRAKIVSVAALDRVTDSELAAHGRDALRSANRMRGIHVN